MEAVRGLNCCFNVFNLLKIRDFFIKMICQFELGELCQERE